MSSSTLPSVAGNTDAASGLGFCPAPPPPPPPPPVAGQVPALRINVEAPVPKNIRPLSNNNANNCYEPPAAIQNAMMTKDKKPFTYTPGMGGKLDLSQIRSPRMARRVAKNANDEGIEGPPKSTLAAEPSRPSSTIPTIAAGTNLYSIQPQVAVPVFPTNLSPAASNRTSNVPNVSINRIPSNASERGAPTMQPSSPESPTAGAQVILAKAPTPWLQNKMNKPQEEVPEWAKRSNASSNSTSPTESTGPVRAAHQFQQSPSKEPPSPPLRQQQSQSQERVIPLRIEDRPSVFSVKNEPGHHQLKQQSPSCRHQQRWGNTTPDTQNVIFPEHRYEQQQQQYKQPATPQPIGVASGGTYIVPIILEGSQGSNNTSHSNSNNNDPSSSSSSSSSSTINNSKNHNINNNNRNNLGNSNVTSTTSTTNNNNSSSSSKNNNNNPNQSPRVIIQRGPSSPQTNHSAMSEPSPVQSRSFRVLQKITDTDAPDQVDGEEQIRKLQLTENDKILMNKVKEQVDGDGIYLHQEEDPRYRGAAIPSRAFRYLQNMTDSGDVSTTTNAAPRASSGTINKRQNRNSRTFEESQAASLPASEQQAPEPKKYTGSAIPSRSFRILQAMTSPESIGPDQTDY